MKKRKKSFFERNSKSIIFFGIVIILIGIVLGVGFFSQSNKTNSNSLPYGDDVIDMTYFHWVKCPHCIKQNEFNEKLLEKYPNLRITKYEITSPITQEKYREIASRIEKLDPENFPGTPLTIIGNRTNVGYGSDETTGKIISEMIEEEQERINSQWNDETMIRTVDLRNQLEK